MEIADCNFYTFVVIAVCVDSIPPLKTEIQHTLETMEW